MLYMIRKRAVQTSTEDALCIVIAPSPVNLLLFRPGAHLVPRYDPYVLPNSALCHVYPVATDAMIPICSKVFLLRRLSPRRSARTIRVVNPQPTSICLLPLQLLHRLHCALDIDEVRMRETSWLASPSINRNADIDHIADSAEHVVQIAVRHLEGHVADKKGLGGRFKRLVGAVRALAFELGRLKSGVLHGETAAFEELLMKGLDGLGRGFGGLEVDVAEARCSVSLCMRASEHHLCLPFAQSTAIAHESAFCDCSEACQLLDQIVLGHVEEEIADVDCRLRNLRTFSRTDALARTSATG